MRIVEGDLTIDESGRAVILGVAVETMNERPSMESALRRMMAGRSR